MAEQKKSLAAILIERKMAEIADVEEFVEWARKRGARII